MDKLQKLVNDYIESINTKIEIINELTSKIIKDQKEILDNLKIIEKKQPENQKNPINMVLDEFFNINKLFN